MGNESLKVHVGADTTSFNQSMSKITQTAASTAKKLTMAFAGVITSAALIGSKFEQALMETATVANAFGKDLKALEDKARDLGRTTAFTATEAAKGMYALASAGMDTKQIVVAIDDAMKFAGATASSMELSTGLLAATISQFGLKAEDSRRITDTFSQAITTSQLTAEKLAEAMKYAGTTGAGLGWSLEQTTAAVAMFTNLGLEGSLSGTNLRMSMLSLAKGTKMAREQLEAMGLTLKDVSPEGMSFGEILKKIGKEAMTAGGAAKIFGSRSGLNMKQLAKLAREGKFDFDAFVESLKNAQKGAGRTAEMYDRMMDTFQGRWKKMISAIWDLNIVFFKSFKGSGEGIFEYLTIQINKLSKWVEDNQGEIKGFFDDVATSIVKMIEESIKIGKEVLPVLKNLGKGLQGIVNIFTSLPAEVIGAAGTGLIARMLLGSTPAAVFVTTLTMLYVLVQKFSKANAEAIKSQIDQERILKGVVEDAAGAQVERYGPRAVKVIKKYVSEYSNLSKVEKENLEITKFRTQLHTDYLRLEQKQAEAIRNRVKNETTAATEILKLTKEQIAEKIKWDKKYLEAVLEDAEDKKKAEYEYLVYLEDAAMEEYEIRKEALEKMAEEKKLFDDMFVDSTTNMALVAGEEFKGFFEGIRDGFKEAVIETKSSYDLMKEFMGDFIGSVKGAIQGTLTEIFRGNFSEIGDIWENLLNNMASLLSSFVMSAIASGNYLVAGIAAAIGTIAGLIKNAFFSEKTKYSEVGAAVARWVGDAFWVEFQATGKNAKDWGKKLADKLNESLADHLKPFNEIFNRAITIKSIPGMNDALTDFQVKFAAIYKSGFEGFSISENANWEEEFEVIMNHIKAQWDIGIQQMMDELGFQSIEQLEQYIARMEELIHQSSATLGVAMRAGLETGNFEDFEKTLYDSIYNQILDAMITAFMQSELFRKALVPFFDAMDKAMDSIYDPGVFKAKMTDAISLLKAGVESVKPAFDSISGVIAEVKAMLGLGGSTSNIPEAHGGASVETSGIAKLEKFETVLTRDQLSKMLLNINAPKEDYDYARDSIITNLRNLIGGDSPEGSFGFNASSRGRPFSGEPTLDQGVFNTAMKDAVMGFITGGPLGALSQAVGTLLTEGIKTAIGYRGAFFDAPATFAKMLGPVGALLGPLAGIIGDAIGDAFDARSTEGLRDFMEASYGYKGGRLGFAEGFYDKIGTSEDPFGVTAQTASFEAGVASTLSSIQDSFSRVGIDVSTELTQAVVGIHAAMGYSSAAMAAAFGEIESNAMTSRANFGAMVDGVLGSFGFAAGDLATAIDDGAFSLGVSFGETTSSFSDVMGTTMGSFGAAIGDIESAIEAGALSFGASINSTFDLSTTSITDMIAALDLGVVATLGEIDAANTSSTKAASTWGDVYDSWAEIGWKGVASIQEIDAITVTLADVISNAWGSAKTAKDEAEAAQIAAGYAEIATEGAYAATNAARQAADSAAQSAADARDAANEGRGMGGDSGGGDPSGGAGTGGTGSGTGQQEHWGGHIPITGNYLLKTGEEVIAPHIVTILSDLVGRIEESGSLSGGDSRPLHITVNVPEGEFETYVRRVSDDVRVNAERRFAGMTRLYS
uniref:Putative tail protein n=1 Tax=viral metagenome TaxID=1070528 RepID=A0A6M3INI9_9ZZZZ